jgi:hypothetical protein
MTSWFVMERVARFHIAQAAGGQRARRHVAATALSRPGAAPPRSLRRLSQDQLTENQRRLLYLVSLYSRGHGQEAVAHGGGGGGEWLRQQALLVLVYEGVVAQVFDYDYAPQSVLLEERRVFFNTSQEGCADIDALREAGLLLALRASSHLYAPVLSYGASPRGRAAAARMPRADREAVHRLVYPPGVRRYRRRRRRRRAPARPRAPPPARRSAARPPPPSAATSPAARRLSPPARLARCASC